MQDHIVRALLSSGSGAIGAFVRLWLLLMACAIGGLACLIIINEGGAGVGVAFVLATLVVVPAGALPAAIVTAIIIAAVRF